MDFARRQLKKYGWKEGVHFQLENYKVIFTLTPTAAGQGLGKDETGIAKPLKVGIKRDHYGVSKRGHIHISFVNEASLVPRLFVH